MATPERLPRGRHSLSREAVAEAQRARLLRGMAEAMTEHGYAGTSVAEILRRARVSRETFYELFSSKEACFMRAFEDATGRLVLALAEKPGDLGTVPATPLGRLDLLVRGYLDAIAADLPYARIFLVEVYAAGPEAARRRTELQGRFAEALAADFGVTSETDRFAIEAAIAAVYALVTARVAVSDAGAVRALHPPLMDFFGALPFAR
jgi:AcrR family transcriptional regulator